MGNLFRGLVGDPTFVQRYEALIFIVISLLLIFVYFKVKKQSYQQFVESNDSGNDKDFSYLTKYVLMQPRSFDYELKKSSKGSSVPIIL
ncbi:MAG: hypothetical protein ACI828_002872 [Flavobacteriales bacterium]|jgi:hypothetical protein